MATAVQKIILSSSRDIPFNKLVLSQSNVRRVKAGVSIEDLAASIARRGLIQSLSVFPVVDAEGDETGMFEVPAGGRRFRALELLVKQKRLAKIAPVPCVVRERDGGILAEEVSLAENIERAPLHPLDQFRAFQDMRDEGHDRGGDRGRASSCRSASSSSGCASPPSSPTLHRRLCRGRHDAGAAHGLHRLRRPRPPGAGLGRDQGRLVEGALSDPAHADRDHGARLGQACRLRRHRGL